MNIEWSISELKFRDDVRHFLLENLNDDLLNAGRLMSSVYAEHDASMRWQKILYDKGWLAPAWPPEYGGCDWTPAQHYIFASEKAAAGAPPTSPMGIQMCAPALIAFGTEAQKAFFLPKMLSGEHFWCQGYSEPNAGSDLASLQMPAVEDGDHLICNGGKIWQTHADEANWIFCLVRTSKTDRPQKGITFILIDMNTPGVEVKPIIGLSGEHIQNQVFFNNVRVPKANIIGNIDEGWTVAKYLLEFERGGSAYAPLIKVRLEEIRQFAATSASDIAASVLDEPLFAAKLANAEIQANILEIYELQTLCLLSQGQSPGTNASVMKILGTELQQTVTELALDAAGHYGNSFQPQAARPGGTVHYPHASKVYGPGFAAIAPLRYLNERAGSIYAGSNEIQKNILAKLALGL
ncbi:acyl-CoA dehydrogenase family protein [Zhongshania sp. BJYM1]|uniref:acyl-CoA dehydrogenase family protein n=1 Tax=Zhongshania aquatica TaxID=2965069 RepID=UPI0022B38EB1|nr:acyl-CoA dehydrogenase family protein [Marortus sp. BJYM1]